MLETSATEAVVPEPVPKDSSDGDAVDNAREGDPQPKDPDPAAAEAAQAVARQAIHRALSEKLGVQPFAAQVVPLPPDALGPKQRPPVVVLSRGSVVHFSGDAVVNAANTGCQGGGGVDGAITAAGGRDLAQARARLPELDRRGKRCETGDAKVTIGGSLRAKWCIHAVGPNYGTMQGMGRSLDAADDLLHSAYVAALRRAQEVGAETVGFSLLSSGIFRGPRRLQDVLTIGVAAVEQAAYPGLRAVHLVAFTTEEVHDLEAAAWRVWGARGLQPPAPGRR